MKIVPVSLIATALLTLGVHHAAAQLVLYDDFSSPHLIPHLWKNIENLSTSLDVVRTIEQGQLRLALTTFAFGPGNTGARDGSVGLLLREASSATNLVAEVTLTAVTFEDCPQNPLTPTSLVELGGHYFNDGSSTGPADLTGDIRATFTSVAEVTDPSGGSLVAQLSRCLNATCSQLKTLGQRVFATPWVLGKVQRSQVIWRVALQDFVFRLNPGAHAETKMLSYQAMNLPNPPPPAASARRFLQVRNVVSNCTTGPLLGSISATIDNVRTNAGPSAREAEEE
jgi:hypothetical protein